MIDLGHRRALDLALDLPQTPLEAVASHEQWGEILDRIAGHVAEHRTTLVFVNTRRLAERLAHLLAERVGEDRVAAHHGSLSKDRRLKLEERLRAGDLKVLVATASLELGIDIGPVELVCQIGSPRSLATFLQRVGRSGHARGATPKGRLYPTTRDELVESAALLRGVRAGRLDRVLPPVAPLDILAQQIVAACAGEAWSEDDLYALVRRAAPFADLARADFDDVVEMLAEGIQTGRGRRGAWLHRDRVNGVLRGRRGARIVAVTSGGAIPETADYHVVADPDDTVVGTVNEDWAIESMAGDIFLLGSTSWRIRRVEAGVVRVVDAQGAPPSVPFWLGEAPARTAELSAEVGDLRARVGDLPRRARRAGRARRGSSASAASAASPPRRSSAISGAAQLALGVLPTQEDLVFERFFDEAGGMQLVVHAPFGGRINRAPRAWRCASASAAASTSSCRRRRATTRWCSRSGRSTASRSRTCRTSSRRGRRAETLAQALLLSPMFQVRWRWNLGRALVVLRQRGGRRNPPPIQRMEADDLMAAVFPALAACQENAGAGPVEIPDHPMVRQTMYDCLHEAIDVDGLVAVLEALEAGRVRPHFVDTTEPSPLSHEILNGRPYTYPRRRAARGAAHARGGAPPRPARQRARARRASIPRRSRACATRPGRSRATPRSCTTRCSSWSCCGPSAAVVEAGSTSCAGPDAPRVAVTAEGALWLATERRDARRRALPRRARRARRPAARVVAAAGRPEIDEEAATVAAARGHLATLGPATAADLAVRVGRPVERRRAGPRQARGRGLRAARPLRSGARRRRSGVEFCERRLLARIHRYTTDRLRREIEPVTAQDFMRFLLRWQHVAPEHAAARAAAASSP